MFDYLIEENELRKEFERFGLTEQDITFVKEQIAGPVKKNKNVRMLYHPCDTLP